MKVHLFICLMFLATQCRPVAAQQAPEPLKQDQVMDLVKAGMNPAALVKLIREHGLDFDLTDEFIQELLAAKAPDSVIQALRAVKPQPLSRQKVLALAAGSLPSGRATELVKERGISFHADEEFLKTLRLAGADDTLVSAVRQASERASADLEVVTAAGANVYVDDQLLGHADTQGKLMVKSALGAHTLKVSLPGKKDYRENITLATRKTTMIEARLEDAAPSPGGVYTYPGLPAPSPLVAEARTMSSDCMNLATIWNSKIQQVIGTNKPGVSRYSTLQSQMDDVNRERVATYRSKLMPQLKDLQQKILTELGRTSGEHLDYEMVQTPTQLIGVCNDVNQLSSQYQLHLYQPKSP